LSYLERVFKLTEKNITPQNIESTFGDDEIIVSKTNLKGHITYVNDVFCRLAEMPEEKALGAPHSIIRHPDMPRTIFYFLWQQIEAKKEIFAYVKNMSMTGKYYWVFAHVTPTIDANGNTVGYHSSRRSALPAQKSAITDLYGKILEVERKHSNRKQGMDAGVAFVSDLLKQNGVSYDEFVWSVGN